MAKTTDRDFSDEDKSQLANVAASLQRNGVREKEPVQSRATDTPSHEKTGWSERGKARDLSVERDGKTEAIQQTRTTWVERLSAARANQGVFKEPTDNARSEPEQAKSQEAPVMPREDRSKTSRTASDEGEKTPQAEPVAARSEAPATKPSAKNKAGWADRDKANQPEGKEPERGTFSEKRPEQTKETGSKKAPKSRSTQAREKQGKTNEHER
jgi:hypothetical protein